MPAFDGWEAEDNSRRCHDAKLVLSAVFWHWWKPARKLLQLA